MQFSKDEFGKEILIADDAFQVAMEWEKPYLEACVDLLKPTGDVLEVGFGLGYAAAKIQSHHPLSHTIIECDPVVLKRARAWAKSKKGVTIVEGAWQEKLADLGEFDQVFFDDYGPTGEAPSSLMESQVKEHKQAVERAKEMQGKLRLEVDKFKGMIFSDQDITNFMAYLQKREDIESKEVVQFVEQLVERGNITAGQKTRFLREYQVESAITAADKALAGEGSPQPVHKLLIQPLRSGESAQPFVEKCLGSHLRGKGRLALFVDYQEYMQPGDSFAVWLGKRKGVSVIKHGIDVEVPPNCRYFKGDKVLMLVISRS